jgi:hypothetical protein
MTFSGFHQTVFSFLTAHSLQQLFLQLIAHSNFFHSHSPTKQTLGLQVEQILPFVVQYPISKDLSTSFDSAIETWCRGFCAKLRGKG